MNNSLDRMIDGLVATLREEVIPYVDTEFARGQAFGVIYMLKSIQLRASWSPAFLGEQVSAQRALRDALSPLLEGQGAPPLPAAAADGLDVDAIEALRDENERRVCALIDWHATSILDEGTWQAIESQLRNYMDRQLKHELKTSAKPMFAEMSAGQE
jgi:hypothetical protein